MNKYAELQKIAIMYAACRGILRVKLAADAAKPATGTTTAATGTGTATTGTDATANNNSAQQDPGQQQAGMGGIGRSLGNTAQEWLFGQTFDPNNSRGGQLGEAAMNWAGKGYKALTNWMGHKGGWVGNVGRFLHRNQKNMGNIISGANQILGGTDQLQGTVRAQNTQKAMKAQQQAQENEQFNPDQMFAQSMQMMANMGQNMYQPNQYSGQTYRPSFS